MHIVLVFFKYFFLFSGISKSIAIYLLPLNLRKIHSEKLFLTNYISKSTLSSELGFELTVDDDKLLICGRRQARWMIDTNAINLINREL